MTDLPDDVVMPSPPPPARSARKLLEPRFVVVTAILLVAAVGLTAAVEVMRLHFKKLPVPLRYHPAFTGDKAKLYTPLQTLPPILGRWVQIGQDRVESHDMEDALQTKDYVFRNYVDAVKINRDPRQLYEDWKGRDYDECLRQVWIWERTQPEVIVQCAVTYYTGKADTVAHIPEVCYTGEGYVEAEAGIENLSVWSAKPGEPAPPPLAIRLLTMELERRVQVGYFFSCNGRWMNNSLAVRRDLQSLSTKYAYYSKIELRSSLKDRLKAAERMSDLLRAAMPSIEQMLPNWDDYRNQG